MNDLGIRSRIEPALAGVTEDVAVVDLADERALRRYEEERPGGRAVGFYPHVRRDLADRARELGIEPVEKRVFFADVRAALA